MTTTRTEQQMTTEQIRQMHEDMREAIFRAEDAAVAPESAHAWWQEVVSLAAEIEMYASKQARDFKTLIPQRHKA